MWPWQPLKKTVCSSLSVNGLQLQQTAIHPQSLCHFTSKIMRVERKPNIKHCVSVKMFFVYSFWHQLRGSRRASLQSVKKNRCHHENFRTHQCFYNSVSKKLSAKGDQVFYKLFMFKVVLTIAQKISCMLPQSHLPVFHMDFLHLNNSLLQQLSNFMLFFFLVFSFYKYLYPITR